jgi:quercetin dioxygenase-like cupin family protein
MNQATEHVRHESPDVHRLDDMVRGWFVGDFTPAVVRTQAVEVAVQEYSKGHVEPRHVHRIATELTVIVSGRATMDGVVYRAGDIVTIPPGHATDFMAMEDTVTVVVKLPSVRGDKYLVDNPQESSC